MSTGQLAKQHSTSSNSRTSDAPSIRTLPTSDACAATASIFLFAQGRSIVCLHHDSLGLERRFDRHAESVILLAVDNVSERGAGRLVASYDVGQTTIIWDLFTGDELARFASYEVLKVAAWMKNGHVAFGNVRGDVITFDPATSEHKSSRTIFDPITSMAPSGDCTTYAIGYTNGSILVVSLAPAFTILQTLSTSLAPSPIVGLAWHASSTKQKSDMLAVQSADGDLRVWSVAKPGYADSPKVIRVLKRGDNLDSGMNWIAWSKNGRIVQYSQGETWAWDVRTKHVAYEPIPTVDGVMALANYGPTATLFTLGPNHTVQQYDINPPCLLKSVRHDPHVASASSTPKVGHGITSTAPPIFKTQDSRAGPASLSTIKRVTQDMNIIAHAQKARRDMASPESTNSLTESINTQSSAAHRNRAPSMSSRALSGTTFSTFSPSMAARDSMPGWASSYYGRSPSAASSSRKSKSSDHRSKNSKLKHEVMLSPEGHLIDLFPYARARLASLPYAPQPQALDQTKSPVEELRRQMLEVVFGWQDDIEAMIRDEMDHHHPGSLNATLLAKWLGDPSMEALTPAMDTNSVSSMDWMLLALSQMNSNSAQSLPLGRTFAARLLQQGDIHTAATMLLGLGDRDDAIDVYTSRCYYMEAILLTTLVYRDNWSRQAQLVRRWGEYVVENSQQQLAIRCFSCTGVDTSIQWASPTPSPFTGSQSQQKMPPMISPPISPPPPMSLLPLQSAMFDDANPQRMTAKTASLKLITSFGTERARHAAPPRSEDRTPTNAAAITPIADSALTPGGTPTSYLRPTQARSKLPSKPPGGHRSRLPSIGETPVDVSPPSTTLTRGAPLHAPNDAPMNAERKATEKARMEADVVSAHVTPIAAAEVSQTLSSARYDPAEKEKRRERAQEKVREKASTKSKGSESVTPHVTPQTALPNTAIRQWADNAYQKDDSRARDRSGSRSRNPGGLHIQAPSLDQLHFQAYTRSPHTLSPRHKRSNSSSFHSSGSVSARDASSPLNTGSSWPSTKSPSIGGRSVDPYISSLGEAQFHAQKQRQTHRSRTRDAGHQSRTARSKSRPESKDRGRSTRYIRPAKRSPSSPVPMSPEDLERFRNASSGASLGGQMAVLDIVQQSTDSSPDEPIRLEPPRSVRGKSRSTPKSVERSRRTTRTLSFGSRNAVDAELDPRSSARQRVENNLISPVSRGRSRSQVGGGSTARSPSSPLPLSQSARRERGDDWDDEADPLRLVDANRQRVRSSQQSTSRRPREREASSRREQSIDRRQAETLVHVLPSEPSPMKDLIVIATAELKSDEDRTTSDSSGHKLQRTKSHRSMKREMAARELEARRHSLAQKVTMPVTYPTIVSSSRPALGRAQTDLGLSPTADLAGRKASTAAEAYEHSGFSPSGYSPADFHSAGYSPAGSTSMGFSPSDRAGGGPYGLPATPRAMRHPKFGSRDDSLPAVPELPGPYSSSGSNSTSHSNSTTATNTSSVTPMSPISEMPRSMSVPTPEVGSMSLYGPPLGMPSHPAFHRNLRPTVKRPGFMPLDDIGRASHSRRPSIDTQVSSGNVLHGSAGDNDDRSQLEGNTDDAVVSVPENRTPIIPELQHLATPPPPPPAPSSTLSSNLSFGMKRHSISSGSGVGTINIVMDEYLCNTAIMPPTNFPERTSSATPIKSTSTPDPISHDTMAHDSTATSSAAPDHVPSTKSPPMAPSSQYRSQSRSNAPLSSGGEGRHGRRRSIDLAGRLKGFGERMRSSSRGRMGMSTKDAVAVRSPETAKPSPYETQYF